MRAQPPVALESAEVAALERNTGNAPLFTVIALCFNHARFLHECLASISDQSCQDFELIVTDDASNDKSAGLIEAWLREHRPESRFIRHKINHGLCATLNEALAIARGQYIAMVATDDRWHPERLQSHAKWLAESSENVAVLFSDARVMDEAGQVIDSSFIARHRPEYIPQGGALFSDLVDSNFIPAMCATISTAALHDVGGYDETLTYEDYDMWLRLSAAGRDFGFLAGTLADYRIVATSLVRTTFARPNSDQHFTVFAIWRKCLNTRLLTAAQRQRLLGQAENAAYQLFLLDDVRAGPCLIYIGLVQKHPKLLVLGLLRAAGLRRAVMKRWATTLGMGR